MSDQNNEVIQHLKQALSHLDKAISVTIQSIKNNPDSKKVVGSIWDEFLNTFFGRVKTKGKEENINLMSLISFPKLRFFK